MKRHDFLILCYYGIAENDSTNKFVRPADFERHLAVLKRKGYESVTLEQIKRFLEDEESAGDEFPEMPFAITFEGAGKEILQAIPLLKNYEYSAAIFAATNTVGSDGYLGWPDLEELQEQGFEIGCSGRTHNFMDTMNSSELKQEIDAKEIFKQHGMHPEYFSYQLQSYQPDKIRQVIDLLKKNNFMAAVTSRDILNNKFLGAHELSRRNITRDVHAGKFSQLLCSPRISCCMIVRDEEKMIEGCLGSMQQIADEIIVIDTGSTDSTLKKAEAFGAKAFSVKWEDNFSKARNLYLDNASKDWIISLDADERISGHDLANIKKIVELANDAYLMPIRTYTRNDSQIGFVKLEKPMHGCTGYFETKAIRLFRNNKKYRYAGAVHEIIDQSIIDNGGKIAEVDIIIEHLEAVKGADEIRQKQISYMNYSKKKLEKNPNDIKAMCDIAVVSMKFSGNIDEAEHYARMALDFAGKLEQGNSRPYFILGEILVMKGKYEEAIELYKSVRLIDPDKAQAAEENISAVKKLRNYLPS